MLEGASGGQLLRCLEIDLVRKSWEQVQTAVKQDKHFVGVVILIAVGAL